MTGFDARNACVRALAFDGGRGCSPSILGEMP